jgi:hypothetical protein
MALELEAPATESIERDSQDSNRSALRVVRPENDAAAELLEGDAIDASDAGDAGEVVELESAEEVRPATEDQPTLAEPIVEPIAAVVPAAPNHHAAAESRRADYLRKKDILQEQIAALAIEQVKLKEQVKLCKKECEVYVEQLNNLIESWENPPSPALSTDSGAGVADECGPIQADRQAEDQQQAESVSSPGESQDSSGREQARYQAVLNAASIKDLWLPPKVTERLMEAGAATIWKLEQLRADISQGRASWPKGIGEAKITAIEDAIMGWMSKHSESWEPVQEASAEPGPVPTAALAGLDDL